MSPEFRIKRTRRSNRRTWVLSVERLRCWWCLQFLIGIFPNTTGSFFADLLCIIIIIIIINVPYSLGKGYAGWFAIAFPVISQDMNLEFVRVPVTTRTIWERHCGIFNTHQRPVLGRWETQVSGLIRHPACKTPGWQYIAGLRFKPRVVHTYSWAILPDTMFVEVYKDYI